MFLVTLTLARKCQLNLRTERSSPPRPLRHRYLTRRLVPIRKFARNSKLQDVGMMS
jgi:hypothetical protein